MRRLAPAILVLVTGCAALQKVAESAVKPPKLTFRSAAVEAIDLEGATIALTWDLDNPNGFGLDLAKVAWTAEAEGKRVASGEIPGGLKIKASGATPLTFPVRVRFEDVPGIVSLLGSGSEAVRYQVSATVGVRTPLGELDLPVSHSDVIRLPGVPRFSLEGLSVRSIGLDAVVLDLRVRVMNPNPFPLPLGSLEYALSLSGAKVAQASAAPMAPLAGGTSALVLVPVRLDLVSAGRVGSDIARGDEVEVELAGKATFAGIPFPLDLKARVPARR